MDLKNVKAIHPERRETAAPRNGQRVGVNPPALLWPATEGAAVRYSVQLAQSPRFPRRSTLRAEGLRWALYNPHRKLAPGTWYWQYGVSKGRGKARWSETFSFEVTRSARVFETPTPEEMIAACPTTHPRIWVGAEDLTALRRRARNTSVLRKFVRHSERFLGERLPSDRGYREKGRTPYEVRVWKGWAAKALSGRISTSIQALAPTYLMTGDERFGREAVRRAVHVAGWDPDGFTAPWVNDFSDGSCLRVMGQAYDSCHELMSETERAQVRGAMAVRTRRLYESMVNNLETRLFAAHFWQHILIEFAEVAYGALHEIPEAEEWATYIYEIWTGRFPLMGGDDGGWANGNGYFSSNIETLLTMPDLLGRMTGVDYFNIPWYRNVAKFTLYTWPPNSKPDGFGDGAEKLDVPRDNRVGFVEAMAAQFDDPHAAWYVSEAMKGREKELDLPAMHAWHRIRTGYAKHLPKPRAPRALPEAEVFPDVGVAAMHTDLVDASRDLMIGFRSSPYGGYGHAQACQNSFNVLYGGERLFHNSGYYIAYGDDHFNGWYKHTRGHNTVMIDGKGQVFGSKRGKGLVQHQTEGYGWIARFLHGRRISSCIGDASHAYGNAGLTCFRRHLILLRPSTIVVYDELEADHAAQWQWRLHSVCRMTANRRQQHLRTQTKQAKAQVDLVASVPLVLDVDDRFDPPALNWPKRVINGKVPAEFPKQWHATAGPDGKCRGLRILAIVQVQDRSDAGGPAEVLTGEDGVVSVGDWRIDAQMDPAASASLEIRSRDGRAVLGVDRASVKLGRKLYRAGSRKASILVEATGKGAWVQRAGDGLPAAVEH